MKAQFTSKTQRGHDVWSFTFAPVKPLEWQAGQSVRLEIAGPYGPMEHRFSIASAPSSGEVTITTRLSGSDYKDSLASLQRGDEVDLQGLEGDFVWRTAALPHIFAAAGIGVTPFHSIVAERIAHNQTVPATLIYSGHDEPMLYADALDVLAARDPVFTVNYQKHRITAEQILALPNAKTRLIYISGPSKMVGAVYADLIAAGIDPAQILQDHFTGRLALDG